MPVGAPGFPIEPHAWVKGAWEAEVGGGEKGAAADGASPPRLPRAPGGKKKALPGKAPRIARTEYVCQVRVARVGPSVPPLTERQYKPVMSYEANTHKFALELGQPQVERLVRMLLAQAPADAEAPAAGETEGEGGAGGKSKTRRAKRPCGRRRRRAKSLG